MDEGFFSGERVFGPAPEITLLESA